MEENMLNEESADVLKKARKVENRALLRFGLLSLVGYTSLCMGVVLAIRFGPRLLAYIH